MPADNAFARAKRLLKAQALLETLVRSQITPELARRMDDADWELAAIAAQVRTPSVETRLMVLQSLERLTPPRAPDARKGTSPQSNQSPAAKSRTAPS